MGTRKDIGKVHVGYRASSRLGLGRPAGVSPARLADLVRFVAQLEGQRLGMIDLAFIGTGEIAELNRRHLGRGGPTDVLSFDLSDSTTPGLCAQIVICAPVAVQQARLRGLKPADELMLYVIHGLLHVMGYDDTAVRQAAKMAARQEELLSEFLRRGRQGTA